MNMKIQELKVIAENEIERLAIQKYGDDLNSYGSQREGFIAGYIASNNLLHPDVRGNEVIEEDEEDEEEGGIGLADAVARFRRKNGEMGVSLPNDDETWEEGRKYEQSLLAGTEFTGVRQLAFSEGMRGLRNKIKRSK